MIEQHVKQLEDELEQAERHIERLASTDGKTLVIAELRAKLALEQKRLEETKHERDMHEAYKEKLGLENEVLQKRVKELEAQAEIDNKGNQEWIDDLCKQLCQMEGALGFKEDQYDKQGQWVPIIGPWLERVRDLIAAEGELGDLRQRVKELEAENGKLRNPCMGVVVITEEAYAELQRLRAEVESVRVARDEQSKALTEALEAYEKQVQGLEAERDELRRIVAALDKYTNHAESCIEVPGPCICGLAPIEKQIAALTESHKESNATPGSPAL